ncbi:MAG TPA: hypothetical protein VFR17_13060 [Mycobacterium sp.]|nr:hypothetical protein [Mycobacterium sp.]
MRLSVQAKVSVAGGGFALAAALLVAGCGSTVGGRPTASPGAGAPQPPSSMTRPSAPRSTTPSPSGPSTSTTPDGAIPLPANDNGYVFIETKSGKTRCQISSASVGCEAEFANSPLKDGTHANGVNITPDGTVNWVLGNLGDIPVVNIDYRTYAAQGWTIVADIDGTRFTNNRTGHGMFVSIDKVDTF